MSIFHSAERCPNALQRSDQRKDRIHFERVHTLNPLTLWPIFVRVHSPLSHCSGRLIPVDSGMSPDAVTTGWAGCGW